MCPQTRSPGADEGGRGPARSIASRLRAYAARHWHGRLPLAVSFWINLVGLRALVVGAQEALIGDGARVRGLPLVPVALALLAVHGALFAWQAVGTVRAGRRHARDTGSPAASLGASLALLALFWLTLAHALAGYQTTLPASEDVAERTAPGRDDRGAPARIEGGKALRFVGSLVPGITRRAAAELERPPAVEGIVLDSPGGNVYEGRGLARLARERGLWTHVDGTCASACAVAFIGGARRTLAPGARLGLHRYRLDAAHRIVVTDTASEQRRDAALFAAAGVAPAFVERMFEAEPGAMWWPTPRELIDAGVVHAIETR